MFMLQHTLISESLQPETHESDEGTYFTVKSEGGLQLLYPGRLRKRIKATVWHTDPQTTTLEEFPLDLQIYDPSGQPFASDLVTLNDLHRFRDLRGSLNGQWTYTLTGRSRLYQPLAGEAVADPAGVIDLRLDETITSSSAPPLVPRTTLDGSRFTARFELDRTGIFVATTAGAQGRVSMRLLDPDGVAVARSAHRELRYPVSLRTLGASQDASANPRTWTLEVATAGGIAIGEHTVTATVLGEGRIGTAVLQERLQKLIGPNGSFIELKGENVDGAARLVMTVTDVAAAETMDMHGLLDSLLRAEGQQLDVQVDTPMVLCHRSEDLGYDLKLDVSAVRLQSVDVEIGPGRNLGIATPVVRLIVRIKGRLKITWHGRTLATARLRDGKAEAEFGIQIDDDGTPRLVQSMPDKLLDIDIDRDAAALTLGLGIGVTEYLEREINDRITAGAARLFGDPILAPRLLMTMLGAHLTHLPPRFDGTDVLFEHVAPLEPDPKPRDTYAGAIGRMVLHDGLESTTFKPRSLGDTWQADNLKDKIDHIVVVMMENRSYDHVLGYRAQPPVSDGADGLTPELMEVINAALDPTPVTERSDDYRPALLPLRDSALEPNALGLKTRIPKGVGHELEDVVQQLSGQMQGPNGRWINDPRGFTDNFLQKKLGGNQEGEQGCTPFTVLGYYTNGDLPITAFLAENYAYCDRYFSSHPGPTLPNRMYSLTGDVQYDRIGVPILANNHGDNFLLSRTPTMYDFLSRRGIGWRVYESAPSVTMLRMFTRYATDDVNIRPIDELAGDVAASNLPPLTVVEPAMHHHPEDDDHPDADMYRGQIFLRRVYDALRANPETWSRTLLVITYDEHGGLYDHVIPPVADVLSPRPLTVLDEIGWPGDPQGSQMDIRYGVRVPTFVVSPWVAPGKGPDIVLDHCSIVKTVLARFCGDEQPFLSGRVHVSHSLDSYLSELQPRMNVGDPPILGDLPITARRLVPGASEIVTEPLTRRRMRDENIDYHEISGRLARMLGR